MAFNLGPVVKVREYTAVDIDKVSHVSLDKSKRIWVSNISGTLIQIDPEGIRIQKKIISGGLGYHTVTQDSDLIYANGETNCIMKITQGNQIIKFIDTGNLIPLSIHSSNIKGDLLVGMRNGKEAKITRYNKTGNEKQSIQIRIRNEHKFNCIPVYITENINGDICISDFDNRALTVVSANGQHRFSYTGQGSKFTPRGLCTDILGHILVCDYKNETVHLLDLNGQFLTLLLTKEQGVDHPLSVCVDVEKNLYVGQYASKVLVYKYLY